MPLFVGDSGDVYHPTAKRIWELLSTTDIAAGAASRTQISDNNLERYREIASQFGATMYEGLVLEHKTRVSRERSKAKYSIEARRRSTKRIGLPEVRNHRLRELDHEERMTEERLDRLMRFRPELVPLLILQVKGLGDE